MTEEQQALENGNARLAQIMAGEHAFIPTTINDRLLAAEKEIPTPRKRSTPVAGKCVQCGLNYSRHKSANHLFNTERTPEPAAKPGKLTADDVNRLRALDMAIDKAHLEWDTAAAHSRDKESVYWALKQQKEDLYKELQA